MCARLKKPISELSKNQKQNTKNNHYDQYEGNRGSAGIRIESRQRVECFDCYRYFWSQEFVALSMAIRCFALFF